jgi:hypothetical protein
VVVERFRSADFPRNLRDSFRGGLNVRYFAEEATNSLFFTPLTLREN